MIRKKLLLLFIGFILLSDLLVGLPIAYSSALDTGRYSDGSSSDSIDDKGAGDVGEALEQAIFSKIAQTQYIWGADNYQLQLDNIVVSEQGDWAKAWLLYFDPILGIVIPTEPAVIVAKLLNGEWQVFLPGETAWEAALENTPQGFITQTEQDAWQAKLDVISKDVPLTALTGYHLPWIKGNTVNLSQSVYHDYYFPSGNSHYAFDFYIHDTMWPIYAAKSGYVYSFRDDVPNDEHDEVNFLVLQNADDSRYYQLYLHLAQNSIPPDLKVKGTAVVQGQYIATVDNTGASTGDHLHFQIESTPYWPTDNPYWGVSVDAVFEEVDIYGGRPRREWEYDEAVCGGTCVNGRIAYVSDNQPAGDLTPPYGDLSGVSTGDIVTTSSIYLSGWGADADSGLDYGQLIANYSGVWHEIGGPFNPSFAYTWDLCAENAVVPDGAVSVALRLYDQDGNWEPIAGLTHFTKDYSCPIPPPSCVPGSNQVTLFEGLDYTAGCAVINIGEYNSGTSLGVVGGDDAESIMVGANVAATLYSDNEYYGHSETLEASDSYLADNLIGANTLSSLIITAKTDAPQKPILIAPPDGQVFEAGDVIPLSWRNGRGALNYQVDIINLSTMQSVYNSGWQAHPFVFVDSLPQGNYQWKVIGKNAASLSAWSVPLTFSVEEASPATDSLNAPFSDGFETYQDRWTGSGQWTLIDGSGIDSSHAWWYQGTDGDYADGTPNFGTLTSPLIEINSSGYFLRFKYRYESESHKPLWDQRWVQISVDGGPFTNIHQLSEDPLNPEIDSSTWLNSPAISLAYYAGHNIQVRFQFATLDASLNAYDGWGLDEFSITTTSPASCSDLRQDDTPAQATQMVYDPSQDIAGEVCPGGDWDYYKFTGSQGDRVVIDIDAHDDGSPLDPYLILYDGDGRTILAEMDDEELGVHRDPLLGYTLPHDGVYYLKVRAWNHPSVGGDTYDYLIRLLEDNDEPLASITYPLADQFLPDGPFYIQAQVTDYTDRISRVEFYWHASNWQIAPWTSLGTDWDGDDGWKIQFDPTGLTEGLGAAVYVLAYDRAGNLAGSVSWNLGIDKAAPYTNLSYIADTQASTAYQIHWTGSDNLSGIDYYQIQQQKDEGDWFDSPGRLEESFTSAWIISDPGHVYGFRMRGVDYSGNTEEFPSTAEISVTVPAANVLCATLDEFDNASDDNSPANANDLSIGNSHLHNFCNPLQSSYQNDEDWVSIDVISGEHYTIEAFPQAAQTSVVLRLYRSDGITLIKETKPSTFGQYTRLEWDSDTDGKVYLQMVHLDGRVIGSNVSYELLLRDGYLLTIPLVLR